MTRIPKKAVKKQVVRHHPFERARVWAEKRLAKAEQELSRAMKIVSDRNVEIPKLKEVIRVHGGQISNIGPMLNVTEHAGQQLSKAHGNRELLGDLVRPLGGHPDDETLPDVAD